MDTECQIYKITLLDNVNPPKMAGFYIIGMEDFGEELVREMIE